ncbi:MAG TPA: DeoR/GlpR family DNA-binding transcription regulator [Ktedonobacteraceae bacterium]|nr:DeoR/GlpR family DNA-binding transcription regulator [Ktedonobacteraceae bacterium]
MNDEQRNIQTTETLPGGSMLFTPERRQQIARLLEQRQRLKVAELSQRFTVSEVTIRKDLAWLETRRLAVRTHGGAVFPTAHIGQKEGNFAERERLKSSEKERIGALAASYVQNGETIALDASTTAFAMVPRLLAKRELTVVTNGLRTGMELVQSSSIAVLMPGGTLRPESLSLIGTWGKPALQQIHISKAFIGARGLTLNEGLTDVNREEVELKRVLVEAAKEVIAVVDASKWDHVALATICPLERLDLIITDKQAPILLLNQISQLGVEVLLV